MGGSRSRTCIVRTPVRKAWAEGWYGDNSSVHNKPGARCCSRPRRTAAKRPRRVPREQPEKLLRRSNTWLHDTPLVWHDDSAVQLLKWNLSFNAVPLLFVFLCGINTRRQCFFPVSLLLLSHRPFISCVFRRHARRVREVLCATLDSCFGSESGTRLVRDWGGKRPGFCWGREGRLEEERHRVYLSTMRRGDVLIMPILRTVWCLLR